MTQTTTVTTTDAKTAPTSYPFVLPSRTLVARSSSPVAPKPMMLEEIRDTLKAIQAKQDPKDFDRSLDQLHVDFSRGHMNASWLSPEGLDPAFMLVLDVGAANLARDVLPARFFSGLRELAQQDEGSAKLATLVWSRFSRNRKTVRFVRTVNMQVNGGVRRVVRSCHSQGYAPYSNLQFVQDILDNAADFAEKPVVAFHLGDAAMRLRFLGVDAATAVLRHWDEGLMLNEPFPMVEAWNSEIGCRRVGLRAGMFKLICSNGLGHWDDRKEYNWIHRGDASRIQNGVDSAFRDLLTTANGVVEAYKKAADTAIDDAFAWMQAELEKAEVSERVVNAANAALLDPTTTPGGCLASVVDAISLAAQKESDILAQYEVERVASRTLQRGLAQAVKNGGSITAEEA